MEIPAQDINSGLKLAGGKVVTGQVAGNVDGPWLDRSGFDSASLLGMLGAATGGPATQSLKLQLFDADDIGGTGAAQVKPDGVNNAVSVAGASADNGMTQLGVRFSNCRQFVKVRGVLAFTGGAGPTQQVALGMMLGGARNMPTSGPNP